MVSDLWCVVPYTFSTNLNTTNSHSAINRTKNYSVYEHQIFFFCLKTRVFFISVWLCTQEDIKLLSFLFLNLIWFPCFLLSAKMCNGKWNHIRICCVYKKLMNKMEFYLPNNTYTRCLRADEFKWVCIFACALCKYACK